MKTAFLTLLASQEFHPGVVALIHSLRYVKSTSPLIIAHTKDISGLEQLEQENCILWEVELPPMSADAQKMHSKEQIHANPFSGEKPSFHNPISNFCKLEMWKLEEYKKIVYLDADLVAIKNIDRLFEFPAFTAAPNLYSSIIDLNRMNSGVMVIEPSLQTYEKMVERLNRKDAFFKRTDQTFFQTFYPDWQALPYTYNTLQYVYFRIPEIWLWKQIKVVHFQYEKPWDREHEKQAILKDLIDLWYLFYEGSSLPEGWIDSLKNPIAKDL